MEVKLPVNTLIRLNCLLSLIISGYVYIFLQLDRYQNSTLVYTIMTAVIVSLIGLANIYIVVRLNRIFGMKSRKFKQYRYIITYAVSAIAYLLIWPIFATLAEKKFSYADIYTFFILVISSALINTLIILSQNLILLQNEKANADVELSSLKAAHAEAANLLLKQQIQPHFLFNALNMLKTLYRVNTDTGDVYMVHLANFLRASISNHASNISTLGEELEVLKDYLEMQKIRFGSALNCTINVREDCLQDYYLPSFSLQPLLENAIKHNELTEEMPLYVTISIASDRIMVANNLQKKKISEVSTNNGLANLAERYRLWSGDEVIIQETPQQFLVSIKLLAYERSHH
ncbi:sensor histidine kinase [Pedobacter sp. AW31-3R]|uniref:sensor histidine kinase n=1 Tax=Pedobacter sp. AW31-3R TaxID=3445781 RepID=UPI003FA05506